MENDKSENQFSKTQKIESVVAKLEGFDGKTLGKWAIGILVGVAVLISAVSYFSASNKKSSAKAHKDLGPAFLHFEAGRYDSVSLFLQNFLNESHPKIVKAKAYSLLGKAEFLKGNYQQAIEAYRQVDISASEEPLLASGALYGEASSLIQLGNYMVAAEVLEKMISKFQRQTGDPKLQALEKEKPDLSIAIPQALYKLALCYQQLGKAEEAKKACSTLIKIYGNSIEAQKAQLLLARIS